MKSLLITALVLSTQAAFGNATVKTWSNPECASGACEVKAMRLHIDKYNSAAEKMAFNSVGIEIETSRPEDLSKYAVVQYIKGCVFLTSNLGETRMGSRDFFGQSGQPFLHKTWEIDSGNDRDPIFTSNAHAGYDDLRGFEIPRNSHYVNDNPITTENFGSWAGKIKNLKANKIFTADYPTHSSWEEKNGIITVKTSSLQFNVCLHKISDVPKTVSDPKTTISAPIACLDWSSNYQFDFKKKILSERASLPSACK